MFAYNPQTTDRSGEILGAGQMRAADTQAQMYNQLGSDIGGAITTLAGAYAQGEATKAKGGAYADFMSRHGEQLGFDPGYLEDFLKKKPYEQAMIGDSIIGMQNTGSKLMSLNYMNQQANAFGNRGPGAGGGGAGGGQGAFYTVQ
jgi:hypothetical protein